MKQIENIFSMGSNKKKIELNSENLPYQFDSNFPVDTTYGTILFKGYFPTAQFAPNFIIIGIEQ